MRPFWSELQRLSTSTYHNVPCCLLLLRQLPTAGTPVADRQGTRTDLKLEGQKGEDGMAWQLFIESKRQTIHRTKEEGRELRTRSRCTGERNFHLFQLFHLSTFLAATQEWQRRVEKNGNYTQGWTMLARSFIPTFWDGGIRIQGTGCDRLDRFQRRRINEKQEGRGKGCLGLGLGLGVAFGPGLVV